MKKVISLVLVILVMALFFGYLIGNKDLLTSIEPKGVVPPGDEISVALDDVKSAYSEKMSLVEELIREKAFPENISRDLMVKLDFIKKFELKTQYEIDQFDYLQSDLSRRLSEVFSARGSADGASLKLTTSSQNYEKIEKRIRQARLNYNEAVQSFDAKNDNEKVPSSSRFPLFKVISKD